MKHSVAVVTMVYNEQTMLPLWIKYYSSQVGVTACYLVDHGSTDGSTVDLPLSVLRIPRSPMDDAKRARFISKYCSSLLEWYDTVIYTDVDEFLIPDPDLFRSLPDYCEKMPATVATAIGLNVQHVIGFDAPLKFQLPILRQRQWVRFAFAMCKPLVTKVPIAWSPGFHSSDQSTSFDGLFLFHLHHFDLPTALQRLEKTRAMPWQDMKAGQHQRVSNAHYEEMILAISKLKRINETTFGANDQNIAKYTNWILGYMKDFPEKRSQFYVNNGFATDELLRVPDRFLDLI